MSANKKSRSHAASEALLFSAFAVVTFILSAKLLGLLQPGNENFLLACALALIVMWVTNYLFMEPETIYKGIAWLLRRSHGKKK
jgi:hypothetical protein